MANGIYETQYIVNSFRAVNKDTGAIIDSDEDGYITVPAGVTIAFQSLYDESYANQNTLEFFTKDTPQKVQINNNTMYPFYVAANEYKGIQYQRIYSFTTLVACTFYCEGLVS